MLNAATFSAMDLIYVCGYLFFATLISAKINTAHAYISLPYTEFVIE